MNTFLYKTLAISTLIIANIMPAQANDSFSHTILNLPGDPQIKKPWFKIINNQADWEEHFYASAASITYPTGMAPVAPVLDFENYQVLSGSLGMRSSGGYYLAIENVKQFEKAMYIHVLDVRPGSNCAVTMALTYPSITTLVKKMDKPIQFSVSELVHQCAE